jgi:hypothetical protein
MDDLTRWTAKFLSLARLLARVPVAAICILAGCEKPPSLPPMLLQISGDSIHPNGDRPFNDFLQRRFPVGSSEAALVRTLWEEGFLPKTDLDAQRREAAFQRMGSLHDICRRDAHVTWSADAAGRLTAVSGDYIVQCS